MSTDAQSNDDASALLASGRYWSEWAELRLFLMAAIPRLAAGSPLRFLPTELLRQIAQLAHRPRSCPVFVLDSESMWLWRLSDDAQTACRVLTGNVENDESPPPLLRIPRSADDYVYVVLELIPHFGSHLYIQGVRLFFEVDTHASDNKNEKVTVDGEHVSAWDNWNWGAPNTIAILFHGDSARVALNDAVGPLLFLDGGEGYEIRFAGDWPCTFSTIDEGGSRERDCFVSVKAPKVVPASMCEDGLEHSHGYCSSSDCVFCIDNEYYN